MICCVCPAFAISAHTWCKLLKKFKIQVYFLRFSFHFVEAYKSMSGTPRSTMAGAGYSIVCSCYST